MIPGSYRSVRTLEDTPNGVSWVISTFATTNFSGCYDADAILTSTNDYLGSVGGCGNAYDAVNEDWKYYAGSVRTPSGDFAHITFGVVPKGVSPLVDEAVLLIDGQVQYTVETVQGVWAFAISQLATVEQTLEQADQIRVQLLNRLDQVLETVEGIVFPILNDPCGAEPADQGCEHV